MRQFAIIDFETTGLCAGEDRIIEVAAILVRDGEVADTFCELMDPGRTIPGFITSLTGITNAMVRGKPAPQAVMPRLRQFLGEHVCIAHNAAFDRRFFDAEMELSGHGHDRLFLCSLLLARRLVHQAPNHKLGTLVSHLGLRPPSGMRVHRALTDVLMTLELWKHLTALLQCRLRGRVPDSRLIHALTHKPKASIASYLAALATAGNDRISA